MVTRVRELVWVACLLEGCPEVEALSVQVGSDAMWLGRDRVPLIVLDVHVRGRGEAETLAGALRLAESGRWFPESDTFGTVDFGTVEWRRWAGWVSEGSREAAVRVIGTGSDLVAGSAVA